LRNDAAKVAIRFERPALAPVEQGPESDFIPLAERIAYYERRDAAKAEGSKVIDLKRPGQG
jgi:hypothetical protein